MVWDDRLSVKEVTEIKRKTPRFPSRERNFAVRRRGPRRSASLLSAGLLAGPEDATADGGGGRARAEMDEDGEERRRRRDDTGAPADVDELRCQSGPKPN